MNNLPWKLKCCAAQLVSLKLELGPDVCKLVLVAKRTGAQMVVIKHVTADPAL